MPGVRRFQRYPINLRLTLEFATGQIETTTDEVSQAGFSAPCPELPEVGVNFDFTVHLPDGARVKGKACAMHVGGEASAGFSCEFSKDEQAAWNAFLEQEHGSGGLWRMIGRYASSQSDDHAASRSIVEKGPGSVLRLHMVGENGEAWRIAFEKHPSVDVETAFAGAPPRTMEVARKAVSRALAEDVVLKRAPGAAVMTVRVVEMARGGFGFIDRQPGGRMNVMGLHGSELIGVEADGKTLFPNYTQEELQRIASDTFRRADSKSVPAVAAPAVKEERFSTQYEHKQVDAQHRIRHTPRSLSEVMDTSDRVQVRVYAERVIRLFPDLWLEVQRPGWAAPATGFALQDGQSLCLFMLHGPDAPRVVKLQPGDVVHGIREK
ncbi:MAG TPA: PilZ domain-containing protein [Archangium sp.]